MKTLIFALCLLASFTASANNYLFECHSKAIAAAKSIDALNFNSDDQSSVVITDRSQKKSSATIEVALGEAKNRQYTVRLEKNRIGSLRGNSVAADVGCFIESVEVK